jgi:5-methylcytosine-specific restriction endonuclease McrA
VTTHFNGLEADLSSVDQRACAHPDYGWVRVRTANNVEQVRAGCANCGYFESVCQPYSAHPSRRSYPLVDSPRNTPRVDYLAYLAAEGWIERREAAKARGGWRCALCGDEDAPLEVHHSTYKRLGAELETDLTVLCSRCHSIFHDRRELAEQRGRS